MNQHFIDISDIVSKSKFDKDSFQHLENKINYKLKENKFELQYSTPCKVSKYINKLNVNKSTGIDCIGPKFLKMCKDHIVLAITAPINNCIGQGTCIFPDKLKIASVIPLHKGGDINDPHNYRPISILPTLSKVFEKHIANQIHSYFLKTDVILTSQSGFSRKHSCQTALLTLIDNWMNDIDSGKIIGSVFLDLRKLLT